VKGELEKAGHTAEAPTLPGHRPEEDRSGIRFQDYVGKLVDLLSRKAHPVVLVGHSSAGFLLQASAPKVPERISHLVFLNAFVLPNGKSQFDLVPPEASRGMLAAAEATPDNTVPVMEDFVRNMLMAEDPPGKQDDLISRLVPQPLALFTTPVDASGFETLEIPKTVVYCREDASLPPGAYLDMAEGLGKHTVIEIEGSHEALFTRPAVVAGGLLQAVG
jgi:pimeloyl-ACP methyl ester carboxylesterase